MRKKIAAILTSLIFLFSSIAPVMADVPLLQPVTGNPLTASTAPYLVMNGLTGQSGCVVTVNTAGGGTLSIQGLYNGTTAWTSNLTVVTPDGTAVGTTFTSAGSYIFNCGNMSKVRVNGTSATGTPNVTLNAGPGISKVLFNSSGSSGITSIVGTAPITANTISGVATIGITTPLTLAQGGTGVSSLASGCLASNGTVVVSQACVTPGPTITPVSVQAGAGIAVATPSPGVFVISGTGVTSVTGSGNIAVTAGPTPNVTITNAPTFIGNVTAGSLTAANLTSGDCLRSVSGLVQSASTDCPNGAVGALTAGTGIAISTPNPNKPTVSLITPVAVVNGGRGNTVATAGQCEDAASSSVIETSNCAQWSVASFVVPAVGATVSISSNENKLFTAKKYTPLFVSDGTTAVQGYVNSTVTNSATITLFETNIDVGSVGATIAANALLSISGIGSAGVAGVTAGSNIVVIPTNPNKPTVAVTNSPLFDGIVTADTANTNRSAFVASCSSCNNLSKAYTLVNATLGTTYLGSFTGTVAGVSSNALSIADSVGIYTQLMNVDTSGNVGAVGSISDTSSGTAFNALSTTTPLSWKASTGNTITQNSNGTFSIGNVTNSRWGLTDTTSSTNLIAFNGLSLGVQSLTDTALTANQCVKSDSNRALASSGSCPIAYASGTLLGGMHIETTTFVATTLSSTTFTFATAYTTAPICTGNVENAGAGGLAVSFDGVPTTTSAIVKNNITGTVNIGVVCVGF